MKKLNKSILVLPMVAVSATPIFSLASCGSKSYFIEPDWKEKQKACAEGTNSCVYMIDLNRSIDYAKYKVIVETEVTATSVIDKKLVSITKQTQASVWSNKVVFTIAIDVLDASNAVDVWAEFDVKLTCYPISGSDPEWSETIKGYKISTTKEIGDTHNVSTDTTIDGIAIESDLSVLTENDILTIKVKNNKTFEYSKARISVIGKTGHIIEDVGTLAASQTKEITFTVEQIRRLFTEAGYSFSSSEDLTFKIVKYGSYKVENSKLYKYDYNGDAVLVSDEELESSELKNKFLIYDNTTKEFDFSGDKTFTSYISGLSNVGNNYVYLLSGEYFTYGVNPQYTSDLHIYGITNSSNERVSNFRTYKEDEVGEHGLDAKKLKFTFYNVNMVGRFEQTDRSQQYTDGMVCTYMSCEKCYFTGSYTANWTECHFKDCTFDNRNTYKLTSKKAYYAMWFYGGATGEFDNCTFNTNGKAVKINYDGPTEEGVAHTYDFAFKNCKFHLTKDTEHVTNYEYPIDINAATFTTTANIYNITFDYDTCSMDDEWTNLLRSDYKGFFHPSDYNVSEGGTATHIKINGTNPKVFNWG